MKSAWKPLRRIVRQWEVLTPSRKYILLAGVVRGPPESVDNPITGLLSAEIPSCRDLTTVPKGYVAVYVGPEMRRFVIPVSYLCSPHFRALMERAADEFGFEQEGGLRIPCEEETFEELLRVLGKGSWKFEKESGRIL
ncbi:indole-3-acetic acid-induced protein ARG7-like [Magnolia sinica]|uniref:indole-3-acetic acid-induced protein ARG7-like n=1 Tax=Magnolia sinica TaxID=86752 RepID=UPI002659BF76|nr:indole-3-acetic acid-induced protein ARG7-like [Magnolia sinica]